MARKYNTTQGISDALQSIPQFLIDQAATVKRSELSTLRMTTGNEKLYTQVIDGTQLKRWVGIGWIDERAVTASDYCKYPLVRE